jgi:hypothetical protein
MNFHTFFECVCVGLCGDSSIYTGFLKEIHVQLGNHESTRSYNNV